MKRNEEEMKKREGDALSITRVSRIYIYLYPLLLLSSASQHRTTTTAQDSTTAHQPTIYLYHHTT